MTAVVITGARGFIAGNLARTLRKQNIRIIGVSRQGGEIPGYDETWEASFGESLGKLFEKERVDGVIHCAESRDKDAFNTNIEGTTQWLKEASERGVLTQVFFSTLMPESRIESEYTLMKRELEQRFLSTNNVVFRLGLVIGPGGMFARIRQSIQNSPIVPLLDGGRARVYVLGIKYLCEVVRHCIESEGKGLRGRPWNLQQPTAYSLRDVMASIRRLYGYKCWFVPIPSLPVMWGVMILERIGIKSLPIDSANLKGLRDSRDQVFVSDFSHFQHVEQDLDQLIEAAKKVEGSTD